MSKSNNVVDEFFFCKYISSQRNDCVLMKRKSLFNLKFKTNLYILRVSGVVFTDNDSVTLLTDTSKDKGGDE